MEVTQLRCSLTRKAPKLSRLQKPQPRKQPGMTNISNLQNVINKNCSNLQNSLITSNSEDTLSQDNFCNDLPRNERYTDLSNDTLHCEDDVVITGINHIPMNHGKVLLEEATSNLISSLNVISHNHQSSNINCQKDQTDVNANSMVTSTPDEVKRNLVEAMSQVVKKRAPRGNKLTRPPPLKAKSLQPNYEALEMELMNYVERLLDDSLSLHCTLQFRNFISKNGAHIDKKNKGLMDNCFDCIQEAITRNTLDSVVEINLKDILLLRRQNWQCPHMQEKTSDVTWKEISMNLNGSSDAYSEDTENSQVPAKGCTHLIQTQQSTDSGFGEDEILWECEEEFRKDLQEINGFSKGRLEDIPEAECPDKEMLEGIRIIGKDQNLVEEAEQILRTHFNRRKSMSSPALPEKPDVPTSPVDYMPPQPPKGDNYKLPDHWYLLPPPPAPPSMTPEKSSVPTSPVDYMPSQPPKGDNYKLPDHWYLLPPPPPPPMQEEPHHHPVRLNRQLSEVKQRCLGSVIRQPIGAGISPDTLQEIEKTMPDGIFTARGRRAMFSRYRTAMGNTCFSESNSECYKYSKEQLLTYSDSIYAREPPSEWSYLEKIYPEICLKKVSSFFDRKLFTGNPIEKGFPSKMWQSLTRHDSVPPPDHAVIQEEGCMW